MTYRPGDIVFVQSRGWLGKLIRKFTRTRGESPSLVNHVGIIVSDGVFGTSFVEAVSTGVKFHMFDETGWTTDKIAVYTNDSLTDAQRQQIVDKALDYEGDEYGYMKLLAQLGDWLLGGRYVFRRLAGMDKYPICSWVVSHAYKAIDYKFDVTANEANPDDIWDFVYADAWWHTSYPALHPWHAVRELSPWR